MKGSLQKTDRIYEKAEHCVKSVVYGGRVLVSHSEPIVDNLGK
jgi:hypothetical protein